MKMKRLVATMLALLLMVSILPIGVMADPVDNNPKGNTEPEIKSDDTMHQNRGTVTTNNGTLDDNRGTVNTNDGTVKCNLGLVETNNKTVNVNSQSVTTNKGEVITNGPKGTVTTNEKDVTYNKGKVGTNAETGTVDKNWGNITTNNGTVNTNKTIIENGVEFKGDIETNNGTVKTNGEGGTVETNAKDGKIVTNNGTVGKKDAETGEIVEGTGNNGTIQTNNGAVITNNEDGTVVTNAAKGTIEVNDGTVYTNNGKVEDNSGEVLKNFATVETNQSNCVVGKVNEYDPETGNYSISYTGGNFGTITTNEGIVSQNGGYLFLPDVNKGYEHSGTIETNAQSGTVLENGQWGTIGANFGTVITNKGTVTNKAGGKVLDNYGIVENEKGGILNDKIFSEDLDNEEGLHACEYNQFTGEEGTYVGTWVYRGYVKNEDGTTEEFQAGGIIDVVKQAIQGTKLNLKEVGKLFKKDGYKVIGYRTDSAAALAQNEDAADSDVVYEPEYEVPEAGGFLSLIWGKIKTVVKPSGSSDEPEPKPTKKTTIPTSLSAGKVTVGAYVRVGGALFRIIEVNEDSIRVATVGKLSEEDLADMLGFLKQHLYDAQIAKINGEPELLEQELVNFFFGGRNEHIAFRAARDLFA